MDASDWTMSFDSLEAESSLMMLDLLPDKMMLSEVECERSPTLGGGKRRAFVCASASETVCVRDAMGRPIWCQREGRPVIGTASKGPYADRAEDLRGMVDGYNFVEWVSAEHHSVAGDVLTGTISNFGAFRVTLHPKYRFALRASTAGHGHAESFGSTLRYAVVALDASLLRPSSVSPELLRERILAA